MREDAVIGEVIVVDNGSTDGRRRSARLGARVVIVADRGTAARGGRHRGRRRPVRDRR